MKITGARNQPATALRPRAAPGGPASAATAVGPPVDSAAFLGVPEAELTPAVRGAFGALLAELDALRGAVAQLKARLAEAEGLADRDPLTPLLNRRAFLRELARTQAFIGRYGATASLAYFDLDGLKTVNDRLGHRAGDAALTAVAERLLAQVRDSDVVGRLGGDEFAVILVQADRATAEAKAQALALAVGQAPAGGAEISLSYGVYEIPPEGDPEAVLAAADAAMYAHKRQRRASGRLAV